MIGVGGQKPEILFGSLPTKYQAEVVIATQAGLEVSTIYAYAY